MPRHWFALLALLAVCACARHHPGETSDAQPRAWRSVATDDDRTRIRDWRKAWTEALAKAQGSGHGAEIAGEGVLLEPDTALSWRDPPPGAYRCRTVKLGAQEKGMPDFVSYPFYPCRIGSARGELDLAVTEGPQRPVGFMLPDKNQRLVFLGALQLGDETRALAYGVDPQRDMAGIVQRIGERRWRLVLPYPTFESTLDVVEIAPAA